MKKALERHDKGEAKVIPIILRPCAWHMAPFAKLQAAPTDAQPVTSWSDPDEALYDVARKIERAVTDLQQQRRRTARTGATADAGSAEEGDRRGAQISAQQFADDLKEYVERLKLPVEGLDVKVDGDKVTVFGKAPSQEVKEKVTLALGNVNGVSVVEDHIAAPLGEQATFYTVQKGDTLKGISKKQYDDPTKWNAILEANKPMLTHPYKIYPGWVLRIPAADVRAAVGVGQAASAAAKQGRKAPANEAEAAPSVAAGDAYSFANDVIKASMTVPVVVDFWAPWCGPCKTLTPLLDKLVQQTVGRVRLVKINVDQNQDLAAQLRIQSVPTVFAFVGGQPTDAFVGAQPESKVQAFIERLTRGGG